MNKFGVWISVLVLLAASSATLASTDRVNPLPEADGLMSITPVLEKTCVGVLVEVSQDMALCGVRWYNNDGSAAFPRLLACCGLAGAAPALSDAVEVGRDVRGQTTAWSEVKLDKSVASVTGLVYVIFQLPEFEEADEKGAGPGFGYVDLDKRSSWAYLSAEGEDWVLLAQDCGLLVEPVLERRDPSTLVLDTMGGEKAVRKETPEQPVTRTELMRPYPNPFNPVTNVEFTLVKGQKISLDVYDLRGCRVKTLVAGFVPEGRHVVQWYGDSESGGRVASGVYFVKMTASGDSWSQRMLLLK